MPNWTADQKKAIEIRNKNMLVAAAAGSGKTTVLVARIMELLKEGANIDEMLIVTFTRAASADMKDKLRSKLEEAAAGGKNWASEQLERLESAMISTIHSFCSDVLRSEFEVLAIDPAFRIMDDIEESRLLNTIADELLDKEYNTMDEGLTLLNAGRGPKKVKQYLLKLFAFIKERPYPEEWLKAALEMFDNSDAWFNIVAGDALKLADEAYSLCLESLGICKSNSELKKYEDVVTADMAFLDALRAMDYENLSRACQTPDFKRMPVVRESSFKNVDSIDGKEKISGNRNLVKKKLSDAGKLVSCPKELCLRDLEVLKPIVSKLGQMALETLKRLDIEKNERNALTFSDLERFALATLKNETARENVRQKYKYIFVDEYQDTSDVQEEIISQISGKTNRFMVGDVKQSIYRFREAEPRLFLKKYAGYRQDDNCALVVLSSNFRSCKCVLDFVNLVFGHCMHGGASEIVYNDDQRLNQGRFDFEGEDKPTEILIIDKNSAPDEAEPEEDSESDETEELTSAQHEGLLIAQKIKQILNETPSLSFRDICIITRKKAGIMAELCAALSAEGVPAYSDASESYFDSLEVMEVMNVLKLVMSRHMDMELLAVLRSPMVGMTSTELAEMRVKTPKEAGDIWEALKNIRSENQKADRFISLIENWKVLAYAMSVKQLIRRILSDTGFYAFVGMLPCGLRRQANLDLFCVKADAYESGIGGTLSGFLDYMQDAWDGGSGDAAQTLGENDNVVRLLTAHKSKGLEFPVVFAAQLGGRFNISKMEEFQADKSYGCAIRVVDGKTDTTRDSVAAKAIYSVSKRLEYAEELRVLYVALTRAQQRLILVGTVKDFKKNRDKWQLYAQKPDEFDNALDIVMPAVLGCPGAEELGFDTDFKKPNVRLKVYPRQTSDYADTDNRSISEKLENLQPDIDTSEIENALTWTYPDADKVYAPLKLTASGVTREIVGAKNIPDVVTRPRLMTKHGLSSTERGTAVHTVLRWLDYSGFRGVTNRRALINELERQITALIACDKLYQTEANVIPKGRIADFILSPIGQRLLASGEVKREWRFNLRMDASEALPGSPRGAEVIVQGSIDLCFKEDDKWVLLDYKTDGTDDELALIDRYSQQLNLYARALNDITGTPVKEIRLCLIALGKAIEIKPQNNA